MQTIPRSMQTSPRSGIRIVPAHRAGPAAASAMAVLVLALALLIAGHRSASADPVRAGDIVIEKAWSPVTPAGAPVAGGYVTIHNEGDAPDRLVSVTSDIAGKSQIHEMTIDANGVAMMRPLPNGIAIPAHSSIELKPGGEHLMFMQLREHPAEGKSFAVTLTFQRAGAVHVTFEVTGMGGMKSGAMNMGGG